MKAKGCNYHSNSKMHTCFGGDSTTISIVLTTRKEYSCYWRPFGNTFTDTPCFVEKYNHTYYTSQVAVRGSNGSTTWNGTECHISPEIAREEVAKMVYQSLTGQSVGPTPPRKTSILHLSGLFTSGSHFYVAPPSARAPICAPERVPSEFLP